MFFFHAIEGNLDVVLYCVRIFEIVDNFEYIVVDEAGVRGVNFNARTVGQVPQGVLDSSFIEKGNLVGKLEPNRFAGVKAKVFDEKRIVVVAFEQEENTDS